MNIYLLLMTLSTVNSGAATYCDSGSGSCTLFSFFFPLVTLIILGLILIAKCPYQL